MRLFHEMAIFQIVKSKVIISLFETVRLSVSISLRNLYNSLNSIKKLDFRDHREVALINALFDQREKNVVTKVLEIFS